uniref:Heparanase-like n=1 Tax=Phallusia mammillata TaxID=59560 RepID=A0A6F9DFJ8_9ASCI|nr:heparanase-like [Phallusia mammillata]
MDLVRRCVGSIIILTLCYYVESLSKYELLIDVAHPIQITHSLSPSVASGVAIFEYGWINYFNDTKFVKLAQALGPMYYRIGGTKEDVVHFETDTENLENIPHRAHAKKLGVLMDKCPTQPRNEAVFNSHSEWAETQMINNRENKRRLGVSKTFDPITLTPKEWDQLNEFCECVGWKLIYGLSIQYREGQNWNSSNAQKLLDYTENRYHVNWELGNEPNSYRHKNETALTPEQIANGFNKLKQMLSTSTWWQPSEVFGPDLNRVGTKSAGQYLKSFLKYGGESINALTVHQYYLNGHTATEGDFLLPSTLNKIIKQINQIVRIVELQQPHLPIWLGETASAYGGGAPGLSNSYIDGFTWLDKLGMSSKLGVHMVVRQTLLNGNYALLDKNFDPTPDYWLTLLYKTLVGNRVLNVTLSKCSSASFCRNRNNGKLRVYAHCTSARSGYPAGSVVVYFLNLSTNQLRLAMSPYRSHLMSSDLYLLEPVSGNLTTRYTQLNGVKLQLESDHSIPPLTPRQIHPRALWKGIQIPSFTYGFLVLKRIGADACLSH